MRLLGGLQTLAPRDINDGLEGWIDNVIDDDLYIYSLEGEAKPIHLGSNFGGDVVFSFTPRFGIGLGVEFIQGKRTSEITFTNGYEGSFVNEPGMSAVPLKLGVFYYFPLNEKLNVVLNAGAGFYFAKYSFHNRFDENGYWEELNQESTAQGLGFHGAVGLECKFMPHMALLIECHGRYAKIGGFEGTSEWKRSNGTIYKEEGKLYYYEFVYLGKHYPLVFVEQEEPSYSWTINVREAEVDFSGFSFRIGLKIDF